jgi:hypothetical protein
LASGERVKLSSEQLSKSSVSTASLSRAGKISSDTSLAWGWPLARERIGFRGVTGLIQLAVHVDGLPTVVMGTTTIAGVDFAVGSEMVVMMEF